MAADTSSTPRIQIGNSMRRKRLCRRLRLASTFRETPGGSAESLPSGIGANPVARVKGHSVLRRRSSRTINTHFVIIGFSVDRTTLANDLGIRVEKIGRRRELMNAGNAAASRES